MKEKTKKELQDKWNSLLIYCWRADRSKALHLEEFLLYANPKLSYAFTGRTDNAHEIVDYINSLELRRCRDRISGGELSYRMTKEPIRAFIANRSPKLNSCLWNSDNTAEELIASIDCFKWSRLKEYRKPRSKQKNYNDAIRTKMVKARSLSPSWSTVK